MPTTAQRAPLWLAGLLALVISQSLPAEEVGGFVVESSRAAKLDACVEPTEYMRRNHMELIEHQQDVTVYGGIRGTKHSLAGCVECHVGYEGGQPVPIDDPGQFCAACHEYTAVKLNCFDCHATIPDGESWNQEVADLHGQLGARSRLSALHVELEINAHPWLQIQEGLGQ